MLAKLETPTLSLADESECVADSIERRELTGLCTDGSSVRFSVVCATGAGLAQLPPGEPAFDAMLLVFSLASVVSYKRASDLLAQGTLRLVQDTGARRIVLLGNQADHRSRQVAKPDLHRVWGLRYFMTSCATGYNMLAPWTFVLRELGGDVSISLARLASFANPELSAGWAVARNLAQSATGSLAANGAPVLSADADAIGSAADLGDDPDSAPLGVSLADEDVVVREPGMCECGEAPELRRCMKPDVLHPFHGRPFWRCSLAWNECCAFFRWADTEEQADAPQRQLNTLVCCFVHNRATLVKTCVRSGPHFGRSYLVCSHRQRCPFFRWADRPQFRFQRWQPENENGEQANEAAAALQASSDQAAQARTRLLCESALLSCFSSGMLTREQAEFGIGRLETAATDLHAWLSAGAEPVAAALAVFLSYDRDLAELAETVRLAAGRD